MDVSLLMKRHTLYIIAVLFVAIIIALLGCSNYVEIQEKKVITKP